MQIYDDDFDLADGKFDISELIEIQGDLFAHFVNEYPQADFADFATNYLKSEWRCRIDNSDAKICALEARDLIYLMMRIDRYKVKDGASLSESQASFIGEFYAYLQTIVSLSSAMIVERLPVLKLVSSLKEIEGMELDEACSLFEKDLKTPLIAPDDNLNLPY